MQKQLAKSMAEVDNHRLNYTGTVTNNIQCNNIFLSFHTGRESIEYICRRKVIGE